MESSCQTNFIFDFINEFIKQVVLKSFASVFGNEVFEPLVLAMSTELFNKTKAASGKPQANNRRKI